MENTTTITRVHQHMQTFSNHRLERILKRSNSITPSPVTTGMRPFTGVLGHRDRRDSKIAVLQKVLGAGLLIIYPYQRRS